MPPFYIGGGTPPMPGPAQSGGNIGDTKPYAGGSIGAVKTGAGGRPMPGPALTGPRQGPQTMFPAPSPQPNILGPQSIRPTGSSAGFDPQYLQNLATAIGGLFSRPGGSLSFNPLGNLSDIKSPSLGFGNAPSPGLPSTMLQDAINGLAFMFSQPAATGGGSSPIVGGGGGTNNSNGGGGRRLQLS